MGKANPSRLPGRANPSSQVHMLLIGRKECQLVFERTKSDGI